MVRQDSTQWRPLVSQSLACLLIVVVSGLVPTRGTAAPPETARYVRAAGDTSVTECQFVIARGDEEWTISSVTERGATRMEVVTRYQADDQLLAAKISLKTADRTQTALVAVKDGRATVRREGQEPSTFDAPRGTIVTSAPDWTDVFLLCRRYDRRRQGKQEFPALWAHPTQAPQRLTFTIERQGTDAIEHDGKKVELDRFAIRIRNNSAYVAWTDAQGRMVRLVPLPWKGKASGLMREGYEKSAAGLQPAP